MFVDPPKPEKMAARSGAQFRSVRTTLWVLIVFICGPELCSCEGKASIKLFGNIGKFANRSGVHEFLASFAKENGGAAASGDNSAGNRPDAVGDSIYLQVEARSLGSHLRKISNEELGVTAMQVIRKNFYLFLKQTLAFPKGMNRARFFAFAKFTNRVYFPRSMRPAHLPRTSFLIFARTYTDKTCKGHSRLLILASFFFSLTRFICETVLGIRSGAIARDLYSTVSLFLRTFSPFTAITRIALFVNKAKEKKQKYSTPFPEQHAL